MKVQYGEEVANHSDPESCGAHREVCVEALTGETGRPAIEPRNDQFGMPTLLSEAEGNTVHGVNRKPCPDPAQSETLCMPGSLSYGSSEIGLLFGGRRRQCPLGRQLAPGEQLVRLDAVLTRDDAHRRVRLIGLVDDR